MAAPSRARRGGGTRSGSTSGADVQVVGLREFRAELKQLENSKRWLQDLGRAQREIANKVAGWSRFAAAGLGGPHKHFAGAIVGRGGVTGARIQIADENANAAFWGAKQGTSGWNAGGDTPNLPSWVGNSWDVGVAGQGPYAINDTIARKADEILRMYGDAIDQITADAFDYGNRVSTF